ncbi:tail fiber domain-containing protein [Bacteroidota bacterium]
MKKSMLFLLFIGLSLSLNSQAPQTINYQAVARDSQGKLLTDKPLTIRIGLLKSTAVVWQEEQTVTTDEFGLFSLKIGDPAANNVTGLADSFDKIDWGSGQFSIKVEVKEGTEFTEMDVTELSSVPYALFASGGPDSDPVNELNKAFYLSGQSVFLEDEGGTLSLDLSSLLQNDLSAWRANTAGSVFLTDPRLNLGVGTDQPTSKLTIMDELNVSDLLPLFEVKNFNSVPVLEGYNGGVVINLDQTTGKGIKGGFAVGGYNASSKAATQEFLRITPDSIRLMIDALPAKGIKGGFAVGGYNKTKEASGNTYFEVLPYQTTISFDTTTNGKGIKGGFAVGGYNASKGEMQEAFSLSNNSIRFYIDERISSDGFGIFGVADAAGTLTEYLYVDNNRTRVAGDLQLIGSLLNLSDARLKEHVKPISNSLDLVKLLDGVYYDWNTTATDKFNVSNSRQIGMLAQDVEEVLPELVTTNDDGYKMVDYSKVTPVLIEAIKELQEKVETLEQENKRLQGLEERISKLEQNEESSLQE